jgi:hypothetical protein
MLIKVLLHKSVLDVDIPSVTEMLTVILGWSFTMV